MNATMLLTILFKEFAENTSIHGMKYVINKKLTTYEKIFWILILLLGLCGALYMLLLLWSRYRSNPTRTSIKTAFGPTTIMQFPAITICNTNLLLDGKIEQFIRYLRYDNDTDEMIVKRALPQLLSFTHPGFVPYNETELSILHRVLEANRYFDVGLVMQEISQNCEEMLLKCQWQFKEYKCGELFERSLTPDGYCCSFNSFVTVPQIRNKLPKRTPYNGIDSGLLLYLSTMSQRVQYSALNSNGLKVFVHNPTSYPFIEPITKILSTHRVNYLQIMGSKMICSPDLHSLSIQQRQLIFPNEQDLLYFPDYQTTNCLVVCHALNFYRQCDCVPFFYTFTDKPICNVTKIPCLQQAETNDMTKYCNHCPPMCETETYNVISTTSKFLPYSSTTTFFDSGNVSHDHMLLSIYILQQTQHIYLRDVITSTIQLLSSLGGIFSLFLGCSFITLAEIIYYTVLRVVIHKRQQQQQQQH